MSRLLHGAPMAVAAILLCARRSLPSPMTDRILPSSSAIALSGIAMLVTGLSFAIWARWHLGSNWSGTVTLKDDHTLVRTGPYRYVRHPIYSGLLLGVCGTAVVIGEWRGIIALGLVLAAVVYKSRIEERRMRETFPEYEAYRRETAALIPFLY